MKYKFINRHGRPMRNYIGATLTVLLIAVLIFSDISVISVNAASKKNVETYVFFGSDSRRNDDSWKSINGGIIRNDQTGTQGTPRSDVIMLLKVNHREKTVDIMSIYRDTLLDVSGKGTDFQKANKAYADLGPKKAVKVLEKNLNIKIDGYVATNFKGVANVIDALGGVTVKIEKDEVVAGNRNKNRNNVPDVMNEYIDEMNRIYGTNVKHVNTTGKHKLTGLQSVAYARVRYTMGSDMRRSVRQRDVLKSMSKKYKKLNSLNKTKVLLTVTENVDTSIKLSTFKKLFKKVSKYKIGKRNGFPYYKAAFVMKTKKEKGGLSEVLVPCNLQINVQKLHKAYYGQKKYKPSKTVKNYSKKIVKKTKLTYKNRVTSIDNMY